jgi:4-hydroxy-tetrahydrodipicolinate synthase
MEERFMNASTQPRFKGVLAPVVTPFTTDGTPDGARLARHCQWLVSQNVGLAVFGTNSEANSLSLDERLDLLDQLVTSGLPPARMMPGTGCCSIVDTARLTKKAVELGCGGVLMLPPFYYKNVTDEGLFRAYASVIDAVGDARLRIYLYHIPPVAQVGISLALIERLLKTYPGAVAGIKDSSGDWSNTAAMLDRLGRAGFDVFVGSESFLLANLRGGGVGCISATANVNPAPIDRLCREWRTGDADAQQKALDATRAVFQEFPMIAALKFAVAHYGADPAWTRVRPPLVELGPKGAELIAKLDAIGFDMPGLKEAAARA